MQFQMKCRKDNANGTNLVVLKIGEKLNYENLYVPWLTPSPKRALDVNGEKSICELPLEDE